MSDKLMYTKRCQFRQYGFAAAIACCATIFNSTAASAYITARGAEDLACVGAALKQGNDAGSCVKTGAEPCPLPNWFPIVGDGGSADEYHTFQFDASLQWNESVFGKSYQWWDHTWYSTAGVAFGPAVDTETQVWTEYAGITITRFFRCSSSSSYSFP